MGTEQKFKNMIKAEEPKEMDVENRMKDLLEKRATFRGLANSAKSEERKARFKQKGIETGIEIRKEIKRRK